MSSEQSPSYSVSPKYLDEFSCVGSACRDTCCAGWRVTIDKSTFKKYRRVNHIELRPLLNKNIKPVNPAERSNDQFATIRLDRAGSCPFLDKKLCKIQAEIGESMLSNTCRTYPRSVHVRDGIRGEFLSPSCPEAARLIFAREDSLDLIVNTAHNVQGAPQHISVGGWGLSPKSSALLQVISLEIIKRRHYPVWRRIAALATFLFGVDQAVDQKMLTNSPEEVISSFSHDAAIDTLLDIDAYPEPALEKQFQLFRELWKSNRRSFYYEFASDLQKSVIRDLLDKDSDDAAEPAIQSHTLERYEAGLYLLNRFLKKNEYLMTNYLLNEIGRRSFPMDDGSNSLWRECQGFVSGFGILRYMLALRAERCGAMFGIDEFTDTVTVYSKRIEHNASFGKAVKDCFNIASVSSLPLLVSMIRDE